MIARSLPSHAVLLFPFLSFVSGAGVLAQESPTKEAAEPKVEQQRFEPVDATRNRAVPVKIYATPAEPGVRRPVVLFSHGLGGSREGYEYLGQHWARAGYVCVFMQHAGSDDEVWRGVPLLQRMEVLRKAASAQSLEDRIGDVSFTLDQLERWDREAGHPLAGRMDLERVGMAGHSFGGGTAQAVMGRKFPGNRQFAEPRLDAFLVLSPSVGQVGDPTDEFGHVEAPVMCMTGTRDASPIGSWPTPESRRKVYAALPQGDKFQLVFDGGNHFTFAGQIVRSDRYHPDILEISTTFWQAYLEEDATARRWLKSEKPRTDLALQAGDVWEWK
jgi:dienelactone hydrolase